MRALCVSIHDVAPSTWPQCAELLAKIHEVARIPASLLVTPAYHRQSSAGTWYGDALEDRLACGDELVLHGYTHLDEANPASSWREWLIRRVYTQSEGEFYAISRNEARRRISLGLEWFGNHGWPVQGFVAPAWLMGPAAWDALREFPFLYTTSLRRFHLLPERRALSSQSLVYSVHNAWRRGTSRIWNRILARRLRDSLLVRLSLHPTDIAHADIVADFQAQLRYLLESRQAMTKSAFANAWRQYLNTPPADAPRQHCGFD